jgi:hypothetical protein
MNPGPINRITSELGEIDNYGLQVERMGLYIYTTYICNAIKDETSLRCRLTEPGYNEYKNINKHGEQRTSSVNKCHLKVKPGKDKKN